MNLLRVCEPPTASPFTRDYEPIYLGGSPLPGLVESTNDHFEGVVLQMNLPLPEYPLVK